MMSFICIFSSAKAWLRPLSPNGQMGAQSLVKPARAQPLPLVRARGQAAGDGYCPPPPPCLHAARVAQSLTCPVCLVWTTKSVPFQDTIYSRASRVYSAARVQLLRFSWREEWAGGGGPGLPLHLLRDAGSPGGGAALAQTVCSKPPPSLQITLPGGLGVGWLIHSQETRGESSGH